jgi:hypothetical protein
MPINDRPDLGQLPTIPDNLDQPARFGAIVETVKDAFVTEIRQFMNTAYTRARVGELPRVDKYAVAVDSVTDPLETAVTLVRSFPDITENLPTIAILSTSGRNLRMGLGDKQIAITVPSAVVSGGAGPFALTDGMTLQISTQPTGVTSNVVTSTFTFRPYMFANMAAATVEEVAGAINLQALYAGSDVGPGGVLDIFAGGPKGVGFPNKITILGGTAVTPLGLTVNQTGQNYGPGAVIYKRHHMAAELTVSVEVIAESENVRTELSDLLYDFVTYVLADRKFQFYGRSVFDRSFPDEHYQIIMQDHQIAFSGEQETARPNDQRDKIYINRLTIPVIAIQYSDRVCMLNSTTPLTPEIQPDVSVMDDLPEPN